MSHTDKCKHLLPCGYCDVKGAKCDVFYHKCITEAPLDDLVYRQPQSDMNHVHDWEFTMAFFDTVDMIRKCEYKCRICGSTKIEADN